MLTRVEPGASCHERGDESVFTAHAVLLFTCFIWYPPTERQRHQTTTQLNTCMKSACAADAEDPGGQCPAPKPTLGVH